MGIACQIDNIGAQTHPALPAGDVGGAGGDSIAVEVLSVVQCVEQAAQCAEHHYGRPVGCKAAALGPHIYVVLGVGLQSRQQQAVGAHIGDNGGGVGHKARRAIGHIVVHRPHRVGPAHQGRRVEFPIDGCRSQCLAGHNVAHIYVVDVQPCVERVGGDDCQPSCLPGVAVSPHRHGNPT